MYQGKYVDQGQCTMEYVSTMGDVPGEMCRPGVKYCGRCVDLGLSTVGDVWTGVMYQERCVDQWRCTG